MDDQKKFMLEDVVGNVQNGVENMQNNVKNVQYCEKYYCFNNFENMLNGGTLLGFPT